MGKAFTTDLEFVKVGKQEQVCTSLLVGRHKLKCGILSGFVFCDTAPETPPVSGVLVKAVNLDTGKDYLGMTDDEGFYAICVPAGKYMLFPLWCDQDCFQPVPCKKTKCEEPKKKTCRE
ncbi:carboxypeptidase-like regulatory domain-containing protein [Peptococcaceae bacterium 1198_IL3148]